MRQQLAQNLLGMLLWLAELTISSFLLSYGAEHLSKKYGAKFVGRTLLSIATTLPEIAIVVYAVSDKFVATAIGSALGSNLLMMTLGLAIMLLIATTRLSKAPLKAVDVSTFCLDKIFLLVTAIVSAVLFIDGYNFIDGFIFTAMFVSYLVMAVIEMRFEQRAIKNSGEKAGDNQIIQLHQKTLSKTFSKEMAKALLAFTIGTTGIFLGAEPFITSLSGFSLDVGVSVVVLAVIISPIAGEMPEKISMMLLARKGAAGASIAIANVLGSKILNNTLLLAVAVFGMMYHEGFYAAIAPNIFLQYQMILVTVITIGALMLMFRREIGMKVGIILAVLYAASLVLEFVLPQNRSLH